MAAEWRDGERLGEAFPALGLIASVRLGSPQIARLAGDVGAARSYRRLLMQCSTCEDLLHLTLADILAWRGVGEGKLREIAAFLSALAEAAPAIAGGAGPDADEYIPRHGRPEEPGPNVSEAEGTDSVLQVLASWVKTLTGGTTWADLLGASGFLRPPEVDDAWKELMASEMLDHDVESASAIIDEFIAQQNEARRLILFERVLGPGKQTLQVLGDLLAVSRERARQLEAKIEEDLWNRFVGEERWRSVRWAAEALRVRLGAFAPLAARQDALPGLSEEAGRVVCWLAGYRYDGDFLMSADLEIPTVATLPRLVAGGRAVDEFEVLEALKASGVHQVHVDELLGRIPGLNRVDGQLVVWGGGMADKAAAILELWDEPQDVEDLFEVVGGESLVSFRNRIYEDPRFIRATKSKVALRSWGGSHYTSVTDLMAQRLASGPMEVEELARELHERYEVSPNSVAMYAYAPMFKVTGETVGLRADDDPFIPRDKVYKVRGLYRDGAHACHWHIVVDQDVLRGSGRAVPHEVGTFLGLAPGDEAVVLTNDVDPVPVSWALTSIVGPSIGSLRAHASAAGATLGDLLRLTFTVDPPAVVVTCVSAAAPDESPTQGLRRLTGLVVDRGASIDDIARSVGVSPEHLSDVLRRRDDVLVAELVDRLSTS